MADGRRKDAIWTYTGKIIRPLDPSPEDIDITDIAHSLANQCRFTGHTKFFYSVAQHSVLVSDYLYRNSPGFAYVGLLHDASEAYLSDIARPIKKAEGFGEVYLAAEQRLMEAIAEKFDFQLPLPPEVIHADDVALSDEAKVLMPETFPQRDLGEDTLGVPIEPWRPEAAEHAFLWTYEATRNDLQRTLSV